MPLLQHQLDKLCTWFCFFYDQIYNYAIMCNILKTEMKSPTRKRIGGVIYYILPYHTIQLTLKQKAAGNNTDRICQMNWTPKNKYIRGLYGMHCRKVAHTNLYFFFKFEKSVSDQHKIILTSQYVPICLHRNKLRACW